MISTQTEIQTRQPMVYPGERGLFLSHLQYRLAREAGVELEDYDILMRQPEDEESAEQPLDDPSLWQPVAAMKYLKHRAIGWHEASSVDELPARYREAAVRDGAFSAADDERSTNEGES